MFTAVIRVAGTDFDPVAYPETYGLAPDVIWRAGELAETGRVHRESGFNLKIGDGRSAGDLIRQVATWVSTNRAALLALAEAGGAALIDIGVTVGSRDQYAVTVTLLPRDLALLAEVGVELSVSAYPTTHDPSEPVV